jgi:peptidase E
MTKFILIGGYPYRAKDGGEALCQEAVKGFGQPIKFLICLFARPKETWDDLYLQNMNFFQKYLSNIEIDFALAQEKSFVDEIKKSDVIYFSGGDTTMLTNMLNNCSKWTDTLQSKTVMGSSAGTDILSTYNYDLELNRCADGYGLVPVKTMVHYQSEEYTPSIGWKNAYEELKNYKKDMPIWALKEGECKVYIS